jgi:hypothetical protein
MLQGRILPVEGGWDGCSQIVSSRVEVRWSARVPDGGLVCPGCGDGDAGWVGDRSHSGRRLAAATRGPAATGDPGAPVSAGAARSAESALVRLPHEQFAFALDAPTDRSPDLAAANGLANVGPTAGSGCDRR